MRFRKTPIPLILAIGLVFALSAWAQQKPFTQDQVQGLVRAGLGDESGAKLIEQRGIDFAPGRDFLQSLKAAGASEAFLKALRAAKPPESASAKKPLNQVQVFALLVGQVPSHRVTMLVQERGIDFDPTGDYLQEVRLAGDDDELINGLKSAKVTKPVTVDPSAQARQAEVRQHVARGAELAKRGQYAEAEQEYRAALLLDSRNADVYMSLSYVLIVQNKWAEAASAARHALRLNPKDDIAYNNLGVALDNKGDVAGAIVAYREALRLNPNNAAAHNNLGLALGAKGDTDGEIAEYREALRLNPKNKDAHVLLRLALGAKGDVDGEIAEYREVLRLNPSDGEAHYNLGLALHKKGDLDGAIAEYREAMRLNPSNENAHFNLGVALRDKGDVDGAIAEYREALRLDPSDEMAHNSLGVALDQRGDRRGALEEFRAAYMLDPKNAFFKQNYERLLREVNQ
ncbi:MAG: tetratricopeptide repeat protein [Terriglobia bacterium]